MNLYNLVQMVRNGQINPSYILQMIQEQGSKNPVASNLATLIQNHDSAGIEALARNLMKSQDKDFDKEFASFKKQMGL